MPFDKKGPWSVLTVTKSGDTFVAAPTQVQVNTKKADEIPDVGEPAPKVATDTIGSVKGDEKLLDTRTPPSDMHKSSFADVVGKKPVALLFATPQLCQSRVCGPVTDIALQMRPSTAPGSTSSTRRSTPTTTRTRGCARRSRRSTCVPSRGCSWSARRQDHRAARGLVRPAGRSRTRSRPLSRTMRPPGRRADRARRAGDAGGGVGPRARPAHGAADPGVAVPVGRGAVLVVSFVALAALWPRRGSRTRGGGRCLGSAGCSAAASGRRCAARSASRCS